MVDQLERNMAKMEGDGSSLYPIAVLIDELRNDDVQVGGPPRSLGTYQRSRTGPDLTDRASVC